MGLYWGVQPLLVPRAQNIEEMLRSVESALLATRVVKPGEQVVLTFGYPLQPGATQQYGFTAHRGRVRRVR